MNRIRQAKTSRELLDALVAVLTEMKPGKLLWDDVTGQEKRKEVLVKATKYIIDNELLDYITLTKDGVRKDRMQVIEENPYLWLADKFPVRDKMIEGHLGIVLAHGDKPFAKPYAERLIQLLNNEK